MRPVRALLLSSLLTAGTAAAAIIDDFSTPQGPLVLTAGAAAGPGIIGGVRDFNPGHTFEAVGGVGTFSTPDGSSNAGGVTYGFPAPLRSSVPFAPVDLTDGGLADLFVLSVTDLFSAAQGQPAQVSLVLFVVDADSNTASTSPIFITTSPGVFTAALPNSGVDLTRVTQAAISMFFSTGTFAEFSFGVDYACTGNASGCTSAPASVPEPSSIALLVLGLAAMTLRRRE